MMTTPGGIPWSPQEASGVNQFLDTPLGRKWLVVLLSRKPKVDLGSTDRAAMTGAFAAGYEHFFSEIAASRVVMSVDNLSAKGIDPTRD